MPNLSLSNTTVTVLLSTLILLIWSMWPSKRWDPRGQHCYVTGGSSGLGLALAIALTKKGADVSIVARNEERLAKALADMEKVRQNSNQILRSYSFSLTDPDASDNALVTAAQDHSGKQPDAVFLCAGGASPGFFVEEDANSLRRGMDNSYWVQAFTALAYAKRIAREKIPGKLVFVSSMLGYMSIVGYSTYSPGKHALRGLAETLRSELQLYNATVHIMFPGTIDSPGLVEENRLKPKITLKIEESDAATTPEVLAEELIKGVQRGDFHISPDLLTSLFRASTVGSTPRNNIFMDAVYGIIGCIGLPLWRRSVDSLVYNHRQEHDAYLKSKGFFKSN